MQAVFERRVQRRERGRKCSAGHEIRAVHIVAQQDSEIFARHFHIYTFQTDVDGRAGEARGERGVFGRNGAWPGQQILVAENPQVIALHIDSRPEDLGPQPQVVFAVQSIQERSQQGQPGPNFFDADKGDFAKAGFVLDRQALDDDLAAQIADAAFFDRHDPSQPRLEGSFKVVLDPGAVNKRPEKEERNQCKCHDQQRRVAQPTDHAPAPELAARHGKAACALFLSRGQVHFHAGNQDSVADGQSLRTVEPLVAYIRADRFH